MLGTGPIEEETKGRGRWWEELQKNRSLIGGFSDGKSRVLAQVKVCFKEKPLRGSFPDGFYTFPRMLDVKMETQQGFPTGDSLSAFSALHFLRNYNQILLPSVSGGSLVQVYHNYPLGNPIGDLPQDNLSLSPTFSYTSLAGSFHPYNQYPIQTSPDFKSRQSLLSTTNIYEKRPRGEKKPIPEDQKDDRYYERRKRNNQAAKKSRDARKLREDQIALRATLLEHENAILRAQLLTLREETGSLRQFILSQKKLPFPKKEAKEKTAECEGKQKQDFVLHSSKDLTKVIEL